MFAVRGLVPDHHGNMNQQDCGENSNSCLQMLSEKDSRLACRTSPTFENTLFLTPLSYFTTYHAPPGLRNLEAILNARFLYIHLSTWSYHRIVFKIGIIPGNERGLKKKGKVHVWPPALLNRSHAETVSWLNYCILWSSWTITSHCGQNHQCA